MDGWSNSYSTMVFFFAGAFTHLHTHTHTLSLSPKHTHTHTHTHISNLNLAYHGQSRISNPKQSTRHLHIPPMNLTSHECTSLFVMFESSSLDQSYTFATMLQQFIALVDKVFKLRSCQLDGKPHSPFFAASPFRADCHLAGRNTAFLDHKPLTF